MSAKLTPWFPGNVKPVRVGVYEKQVARSGIYQYWNGMFWCGWSYSVISANEAENITTDHRTNRQIGAV